MMICSMLVLIVLQANADNGGDSPKEDIKIIILNPNYPIGHRHKSSSMQSVPCTYSDGNLTFEFAYPEGNCSAVLSDLLTGETVVANFDSAVTEPVYVGYHATASLTVTTSNGNTYSGMW